MQHLISCCQGRLLDNTRGAWILTKNYTGVMSHVPCSCGTFNTSSRKLLDMIAWLNVMAWSWTKWTSCQARTSWCSFSWLWPEELWKQGCWTASTTLHWRTPALVSLTNSRNSAGSLHFWDDQNMKSRPYKARQVLCTREINLFQFPTNCFIWNDLSFFNMAPRLRNRNIDHGIGQFTMKRRLQNDHTHDKGG